MTDADHPRGDAENAGEEYLREVGLSGIVADAKNMLAELEKPDAK